MIKDFKDIKQQDLQPKTLIIGGGAAGIILAKKLAELGESVTLLESGGRKPDKFTRSLTKGKNIGESFLDLNNSRPRCLGGSTRIWGGVCHPYSKSDMEHKDFIPLSGWPIKRNELLPFYQEASEVLGFNYNEFNITSWKNRNLMGIHFRKLVDENKTFHGKYFKRMPSKDRDFSKLYSNDLENSKLINIFLNTTVTNISLNSKKNQVKNVEVKNQAGKTKVFQPNKVILACGALENARLMLLSQDLKDKSNLIGKCFMSHPSVTKVAEITIFPDSSCAQGKEQWDGKIERFALEINEKVQKELKILGHTIGLKPSNKSIRAHLAEIKRNILTTNISAKEITRLFLEFPYGRTWDEGVCKLKREENYISQWTLSIGLEQPPRYENFLQLSNDKDALNQKRMEMHWDKLSSIETDTIEKVVSFIAKELGKKDFGRVKLSPKLIDRSIFKFRDPINHHIGTTRMATSVNEGVVDTDSKVFGVNNLYVTGSSTFPTSSSVNPTFTIVAMALRLAKHLKNL